MCICLLVTGSHEESGMLERCQQVSGGLGLGQWGHGWERGLKMCGKQEEEGKAEG